MKVLQNLKDEKRKLEIAIKVCKNVLGEEIEYTIEQISELKNEIKSSLEMLEKLIDYKGEKLKTSCGGTKNMVEVLLVNETKLYKDMQSFMYILCVVEQLFQTNDLSKIKGFNFTKNQINNTANLSIKR